ncbi:MAG TPA: class I SAM-dependent RNA methyltransferase [Verrucomicrobiales bacterium]|nr:class I SAM-dependent RNA methyltransferase [Verrucomicrobiales bacterium]HIL24611.1 class I SAM-dependent RNA methyltransferase [Verrucomicrobiota bacterium]
MEETAENLVSFNVGDRLEVEIADMAFGGDGVGKVDGFVVFVPFVIVGEVVLVEITERKSDFARARLLEVITPSPDRVDPKCQYFGECGGCQYQHIDYEAQGRIKLEQVRNLFVRVGGFAPEVVGELIPCPAPYGYRNRIMIRRQWDKFQQKAIYGFLRAESRLVVDLERCEIAEEALNDQLQQVRENPPARNMQKVVLRMMPDDWELHRDSFFQNNFSLLPKLVETVRGRLADAGTKFLVDAYCGIGFFSLSMADLVEGFVGIDIDKQCILPARKNLAERGIENGEFIQGKTEEQMDALLERFPADDTTLILDPPRKGVHKEGLEMLANANPRQVIYVSCHPATLARDLKWLCEQGYELKSVTALDMFPQTQHVECVADLRRS